MCQTAVSPLTAEVHQLAKAAIRTHCPDAEVESLEVRAPMRHAMLCQLVRPGADAARRPVAVAAVRLQRRGQGVLCHRAVRSGVPPFRKLHPPQRSRWPRRERLASLKPVIACVVKASVRIGDGILHASGRRQPTVKFRDAAGTSSPTRIKAGGRPSSAQKQKAWLLGSYRGNPGPFRVPRLGSESRARHLIQTLPLPRGSRWESRQAAQTTGSTPLTP